MTNEALKEIKDVSELLSQNWENARYHESSRWKYTYYYYAAFGAYVIYFFQIIVIQKNGLLQFPSAELFISSIIYFFLMLIGRASFYHLLYSNMEYKNNIRVIEYISRDLKLNKNIAEYRKGNKGIVRSTYIALPLMLKIRNKMPFTVLTAFATGISAGASFFLFLVSFMNLKYKEYSFEYIKIIFLFSLISLIISFFISRGMIKEWNKTESAADIELDKRDPMIKFSNNANSAV